jgi:hypothetical protein
MHAINILLSCEYLWQMLGPSILAIGAHAKSAFAVCSTRLHALLPCSFSIIPETQRLCLFSVNYVIAAKAALCMPDTFWG